MDIWSEKVVIWSIFANIEEEIKMKNHVCNQCGSSFAYKQGLECHVKGVHSGQGKDNWTKLNVSNHSCKMAPLSYWLHGLLKTQLLVIRSIGY